MFSGSIGTTGTATTPTAWGNNHNGWIIVGARSAPSIFQIGCDELRVLMLNPLAPFAILVAEIRERLRCVRPVLLDLPRSTWLTTVLRRARSRDVHHGDHLLNFCRMPA